MRLGEARAALERAEGRYARASAIDALIDLATSERGPALGMACLRAVVRHLDRTGDGVSAIEIDRARALRDHVDRERWLGPPLDPPRPPTPIALRARAALAGEVRGPIPPPDDPEHGEALALTALAYLRSGRIDAARPLLSALNELDPLPRAIWAVIAIGSEQRGLRSVLGPIAARAVATVPLPRFSLATLALRWADPNVLPIGRALALAAHRRGEASGAATLAALVEKEALRLRDHGHRPQAIAMLRALERDLAS